MQAVTDLLHAGFAGDLTTLRSLQLLAGLSTEDAARFCLVAPETYRRWRSDRRPNPTAVRLLAIRAGYLPWPEWIGWEMHAGYLLPPGWRRHGIAPGDVLATPYLLGLVREYQRQQRARRQRENPDPGGRHRRGRA